MRSAALAASGLEASLRAVKTMSGPGSPLEVQRWWYAASTLGGAWRNCWTWLVRTSKASLLSSRGLLRVCRIRPASLVVLDQVVVGAARVGEGVEPQGIDDGEPEQIKVGIDGPQVGDVEFQDVVAHYEGGPLAQLVDAPDAGGVSGVVALEVEFIAGVGPVGGHGDEAAFLVYFQVQRKAVPERWGN